jgi:hypothetical protein
LFHFHPLDPSINNKAPGLSGMRSEDIKGWAKTFEDTDPPSRHDLPFSKLVDLVQLAFSNGTLPKNAYVSILILILKAHSMEFRGIGLLEIIWKLISAIIDTTQERDSISTRNQWFSSRSQYRHSHIKQQIIDPESLYFW